MRTTYVGSQFEFGSTEDAVKFPRVWENGIPIKIATKSNAGKPEMAILYYLVDLAFVEISYPLIYHKQGHRKYK